MTKPKPKPKTETTHATNTLATVALATIFAVVASPALGAPIATVTSSATTSSTTARALAACEARVDVLRNGLDQINGALAANEDEDASIIDHWPSILTGAICIAAAAIASEERDWGEVATASLVSVCGVVGIVVDLVSDPGHDAEP